MQLFHFKCYFFISYVVDNTVYVLSGVWSATNYLSAGGTLSGDDQGNLEI